VKLGRGDEIIVLEKAFPSNYLPWQKLSQVTGAEEACLSLELTKSLGALPLEIERVRPDFVIAAGYKWLLFPYGLSLFYADPRWHQERPLEETWLSREGAEVFERPLDYAAAYQAGARRFEMGQKSFPPCCRELWWL
jgi:selenocysteine lyase/cysteine desulfurase